jgi:hypothetical protein
MEKPKIVANFHQKIADSLDWLRPINMHPTPHNATKRLNTAQILCRKVFPYFRRIMTSKKQKMDMGMPEIVNNNA